MQAIIGERDILLLLTALISLILSAPLPFSPESSSESPPIAYEEPNVTTTSAKDPISSTSAYTTVLAYTTTPPVSIMTQVVSTSTPVTTTSVPIDQVSTTLSTVIMTETSITTSIATPTTTTPNIINASTTTAEPYDMYKYQDDAANEENADELKDVDDEHWSDSPSFIFPPRFKFMEDQLKHKIEDMKQEEKSKIENTNNKDDDAALIEDSSVVPPRFKYMEKQIKEIKVDLKQEEPYTVEQTELEDETWNPEIDTNDDDADLVEAFPVVPPRFKYMEKQIMETKKDIKQEKSSSEEQTERNDETSTTEIPLPPRFKYMEKQIKQDKANLEEVEDEAQNDATVSTIARQIPDQFVVGAESGPEVYDIREDFEQGSVQRKVYNKFSREERQQALKEMEEEEEEVEEYAPQQAVDIVGEGLKKSCGWFCWLPFW